MINACSAYRKKTFTKQARISGLTYAKCAGAGYDACARGAMRRPGLPVRFIYVGSFEIIALEK